MDLKSGRPFWSTRDGLPASFPRLTQPLDVEVAVIGAGSTGALAAHALAEEGRDVVVLDGRDVGCGSTSASTAMIQYEIDTPLTERIRRYGEGPGRGGLPVRAQSHRRPSAGRSIR